MGRTLGIVVPHYNDSRFLEGAVESALAGARPADRILVIDDGSRSEELAAATTIVRALGARFPHARIDLEPQRVNRGVVSALNLGLERIATDYVLFRAADDRTTPAFFRAIIELLERHPEAGLGAADIRYYTESPDEGVVESLGLPRAGYFSPEELVSLLSGTRILHSAAVVLDRRKLQAVSGFPPDTDLYHDWWSCHQLAFRHGIVYWPSSGAAFRLRADSVSSRMFQDLSRARRSVNAVKARLAQEPPEVRARFSHAGMLTFFDSIERTQSDTPGADGLFAAATAGGLQAVIGDRLIVFSAAIRAVRGRIFIFGAGNHSVVLLQEWQRLHLPAVSSMLASAPDRSMFAALPVVAASQIELGPRDLVVLSSKSFEEAMAVTMKETHPHTAVLSFWNPRHTTLRAAAKPSSPPDV